MAGGGIRHPGSRAGTIGYRREGYSTRPAQRIDREHFTHHSTGLSAPTPNRSAFNQREKYRPRILLPTGQPRIQWSSKQPAAAHRRLPWRSTGATGSALNLKIQYWTSRGFAVLDVNYRGSTGYGRQYRQQLHGQWGIVDVDDVTAGARYLIEQQKVDPQKIAIRGSSAGGYTVLAALCFRDMFKAGACLYGIGDLETTGSRHP